MEGLVKFRNWLLLAAVVTLVVCIPIAGRLTFDQTIESFFPPDNPDIQLLLQSRQDFGGDEFVNVSAVACIVTTLLPSLGFQGAIFAILFAASVFCFFVESLGALVLVVVRELAAELDAHVQMPGICVDVINKINR